VVIVAGVMIDGSGNTDMDSGSATADEASPSASIIIITAEYQFIIYKGVRFGTEVFQSYRIELVIS